MSVNSMYGFNPYAGTGLNDDFMANAAGLNNPYAQLAQQQALLQQGAQQGDVYQSGGTSPLTYAAVGGLGVGAGTYFFGDKFGAALTKDGKTFSDDILKAFQGNPEELALTNSEKEIVKQQEQIAKKYGFKDYKEFKAASENPKISQKQAQNVLKAQQELGKIDAKAIAEQELAKAKAGNLGCQTEELANLAKRKGLLEGLPKDAKVADIEKLIQENPKAFGIEKTVEAEIQAEAKALAGRYGSKANAVGEVTNLVKTQEALITKTRKSLNRTVATHWDDAAKTFQTSAPDSLTKAAKNFKWTKAGKFGALAAGAGLLLGWMFGK